MGPRGLKRERLEVKLISNITVAVEATAFDCRKSGMCEWASLIQWLYDKAGMVIDTKDSKGETAMDLARKWDIYDVRVESTLMGWKW